MQKDYVKTAALRALRAQNDAHQYVVLEDLLLRECLRVQSVDESFRAECRHYRGEVEIEVGWEIYQQALALFLRAMELLPGVIFRLSGSIRRLGRGRWKTRGPKRPCVIFSIFVRDPAKFGRYIYHLERSGEAAEMREANKALQRKTALRRKRARRSGI